VIGEYIDLDWRTIEHWDAWTQRQGEGAVVRVYRDYAREKQATHAEREQRLAAMTTTGRVLAYRVR
jgi:hypothetical protein